MLTESGKAAAYINQCRQTAEVMPSVITERVEAPIRQLVESVTVETDGRIITMMKSGTVVRATI